MKKRMTTGFVTWVVILCIGLMQIPAFAEGQHYMYSRYDGAAILVANGQEAAFAQGYANPDETITVYSRVDGAPAVIWSYEVAGNQEYYATGQQNIRMFSKYDGAMILVHSYEAMGFSANYYGEKATITVYSKVNGTSYKIWATNLASYLSVGYSTTKPYIPIYGYKECGSVPSFGNIIGVADYPIYDSGLLIYDYTLPLGSVIEPWERYEDELIQWGFWYYNSSDVADFYTNGVYMIGVGYISSNSKFKVVVSRI